MKSIPQKLPSLPPNSQKTVRLQLRLGNVAVGGIEGTATHHGFRHKIPQQL